MATDIVQSLFGISPDMLQRQQDAMLDRQALQFAQMDPFERANYGIFRGSGQLGGALGRALGGQDPELARVSLRQSLAQQIDFNDPTSIQEGVRTLTQAGDTMGAMMLADTARKAMSELALARQRAREGAAKDPLQELLRSGKYTPESIREYATTGDIGKLVPQVVEEKSTPEERNARAFAATKGAPGSAEFNAAFQEKFTELISKRPAAKISTVGVAQGTNKPVYIDENTSEQFTFDIDAQGKQVRKPYVGGVDRTVSKVSVGAPQGEAEFIKELGKLDAKRVQEAVALRDNSIAAINTFQTLSQLNDEGLISGTFATGRVGATNLLNTLGLVSPAESEKLARSENYQKVAGDAILATLGGKLGAGFSNEDRKFIQGLVPQLENSPLARRQLIDFMLRKNRAIVEETTRLEKYARDNKGLGGYAPTVALPGGPTPAAGAAGTAANPIKLK